MPRLNKKIPNKIVLPNREGRFEIRAILISKIILNGVEKGNEESEILDLLRNTTQDCSRKMTDADT